MAKKKMVYGIKIMSVNKLEINFNIQFTNAETAIKGYMLEDVIKTDKEKCGPLLNILNAIEGVIFIDAQPAALHVTKGRYFEWIDIVEEFIKNVFDFLKEEKGFDQILLDKISVNYELDEEDDDQEDSDTIGNSYEIDTFENTENADFTTDEEDDEVDIDKLESISESLEYLLEYTWANSKTTKLLAADLNIPKSTGENRAKKFKEN